MISNKKVLGITLARGGSKGVKNKNIRNLVGKPLIAHTISEVQKCRYLTDYIVSTDSKIIQEIVSEYGAIAPFLRPADLARDSTSSVDALKHAVQWMEYKMGFKYDYVIEIMCTNPFKIAKDIDSCIKLLDSKQADSVIAVHKIEDHHPARVKKIINGRIRNFCISEIPESRRQDLTPEAYVRSGSIYALNRDYLINKSRRYGSRKSFAYILPESRVINIDTEIDFLVAEAILKNK